jgi:hypothetical protein
VTKELVHIKMVRKQRETGRGWDLNLPFKDIPPMTYLSLAYKGFHLFSTQPQAGDQAFNTWTLGTLI